MRKLLAWIIARAKEPSTWTGLAVIAGTLGVDAGRALTVAQGVGLIVGGALVAATTTPALSATPTVPAADA
jgi:hypothetical protein